MTTTDFKRARTLLAGSPSSEDRYEAANLLNQVRMGIQNRLSETRDEFETEKGRLSLGWPAKVDTCEKCSAMVSSERMDDHLGWHAKLEYELA